ncbi:MAG TPA: hypothetical protein VM143_05460 [Acidimicrobiales bacterium]|nr:hypothetical protein [Acidimicrobiales bacterium]
MAIALGGLALRLAPLLSGGGPLAFPVDYDEGVYFGASGLLASGHLPYRDVIFVHPPMWLLLLLPFAGALQAVVGADRAFAVAVLAMPFVGAVNVVLCGIVGRMIRGPVAGVLAAALYATYPAVVAVERGTFLEPSLNLFVLLGAMWWLRSDGSRRSQLAAGAAFGLAFAAKTWGAFAALAALASLPVTTVLETRRAVLRLAIGAAGIIIVFVLPFLLLAPRDAAEQLVRFQLFRAPDGAAVADRVRIIFEPLWIRNRSQLIGSFHGVSATGAGIGAICALARAWRRDGRAERFLLVLAATTIGAFLIGRTFWLQYLSHLVVAEVLLAGYAAGTAWTFFARRPLRLVRPVLALALAATPVIPFRQSMKSIPPRTHELHALADLIARDVPPGACLFAFEPAWGVASGRLPPAGFPPSADPYASMLLPTSRPDLEFEGVGPAFEVPSSQVGMRRLLEHCDWVVYGGRGPAQLSAASEAWFQAAYERVAVVPGPAGLDLWHRIR